MLTRHAITKRADNDGVDAAVVERDYVLAHVVAQLAYASPSDGGGRLILKGGTALRFVHVEGYRYSADLDFTVLGGSSEGALTRPGFDGHSGALMSAAPVDTDAPECEPLCS